MFLKVIFILLSAFFGICIAGEEIGMPLIQISHGGDLGDDYPEMREEVHLEDFFWTGSGDGPPDYLKKVHTGISKGKDVIVKTETVVATVYVDGNNEIDIPICLDCPPDDGGGGGTWGVGNIPPLNKTSTDRRYWLLTVMSGFYSQRDNPGLEDKLAKLYRLAFTRQQSKHLGINGAQQIYGVSVPNGKGVTSGEQTSEYEILDMTRNHSPPPPILTHMSKEDINSELMASASDEFGVENIFTTTTTETQQETTNRIESTTKAPAAEYVTLISWELLQNNGKPEKLLKSSTLPRKQLLRLQQLPFLRDDRVRVVIHNITQITADDIEKGKAAGLYDEDVNEKIDERPIANQTELIYSVFVNGRPVMAVAAANDMKLVSEAEVEKTFGKNVIMKAEPYLREPEATPLAPATRSGSIGFLASLQNNTALIIVSSVAILLLLLLLLALLLMGRSHVQQRNAETNRSSSQHDLLSESQSARPPSTMTAIDTNRSIATARSRDIGVQNLSFEQERARRDSSREARIHFPGPPEYEISPRRVSITSSSDNTSDSSVYCPINSPTFDGTQQRFLDEKSESLFDKQKKRHQYDRAEGHEKEPSYTAVISEKGRTKPRHKTKRKYLSENRVGSLENSPAQRVAISSGEEAVTDDSLRPTAYERTEAFNAHNNYNRNKLLHQKTFTDKGVDDIPLPEEAINKEIIRALQPSRKSSDTGSIGSFLSMASVKAFPKQTLPEPLNKVLEPVFVTYYDNVEDQKTSQRKHSSTIATIESFPSPKAPGKSMSLRSMTEKPRSQSDNADPGVVGPIVWERHKKKRTCEESERETDYANSPIRDPAAMRSHYEGLLEGAIQMYSSQEDLPMPLPTRDFTNNRRPMKREYRGSSAGATGYASKSFEICGDRPATAHAPRTSKSNQSTQPSSPTSGAWGGSIHSSSYSPVVRPLSAGPTHHQPHHYQREIGAFRDLPTSRRDLDAAPLVRALQHELEKYKRGTE